MRYHDYLRLEQILENNITKKEYHTILEHSDQTIITHDESHSAKYFNTPGYDMLKQMAEMTDNMESYFEDLEVKKRIINSHG